MGALIRAFNWAATPLGPPNGWPPALRTTLGILLRSRFPMFLWWGPELIQFYNDAYRPSLGNNGKHPGALGKPGAETWPEIWPAIKPLVDGVLAGGESVWQEDQLIPIHRNGKVEDVYWTFSYSAVLNDEGTPAGVLAVCSETTEKVAALKPLKEKELSLELAVNIGNLGIFNVDFTTGVAAFSPKVRDWYGLDSTTKPLEAVLKKIHPDDQGAVGKEIEETLRPGGPGRHDFVFRVVANEGQTPRHLRSIGQAQWQEGRAVAITGVLQDVTHQMESKRKLEESEAKLRSIISTAPPAIGLFMGRDLVVELPNQTFIDIVGKGPDIEGKPLREVMPELLTENQPFLQILDEVYNSGHPFRSFGSQVKILRDGVMTDNYYNITYSPLRDEKGKIYGILDVAVDVTGEVLARKALEESQQRFQNLVRDATVGIVVLTGPEAKVEIVNESYGRLINLKPEDLLGKNLFDVIPDAEAHYRPLLDKVRQTGEPLYLYDSPYAVVTHGQRVEGFLNVVYQPYRNAEGTIVGIMALLQDVTESVKAKKALEESEARFRSLIEEAPVATCLFTGRDLVIEVANPQMMELWGKDDGVLGKPLAQALPELEGQPFLAILGNVYATGQTFEGHSMPCVLKRGGALGTYYFDFTYKPLRNAAGKVYAVMDMAVEVTDQVLSRKKIEESNQQIRSLIESAPFPIAVYTGREMRIQMANQAIIDAWGKGSDIVGKLYAEVLPEVGELVYKQLDDVYTTGVPYQAHNRRVDLMVNGKLQPYYFNYSFTPLFDAEGKVYGVMNTGADVTDLNLAKQAVDKSEASLRNAIELAELATWSLNIKEGTFNYSPRFMQWLGFAEDSKDADAAYNPLPDGYRESVPAALAAAVAPGSSGIYENEHPVVNRTTGQVRIVHAQAQVFYNAAGEPEVLSGLAQDVTKEREMQRALEFQVQQRTEELSTVNEELTATNEELAKVNTALQHNNQELEQFAYIASHDLQEPLRKVSTFTEMLKTSLGEVDPRSQTYLTKITASTARMLQLIKDVLNFSQLSAGKETFVPVDLNDVVAALTADFELLIEQKGAVIRYGNLPTVDAIPLQMQQLFGNLVSNALKFSRADAQPVITITSQPFVPNQKKAVDGLLHNREYVHIKITDNGIGFSQEYADRIFGIFQRLHGRTEYAGTGIGLALCKKIAQNHHGEIWAAGIEGTGAVFNVLLPLHRG